MTLTVNPAATGGWHAFAAAPRLLLVAAADEQFVAKAWATIAADDGFQSALDLLTSKGLAATPSFVLIEWEAGTPARVIVRGESDLIVTDAAGEQRLSAAGVSTWVERSMPDVLGISFAVPGATPVGTVGLPLERGVAYVAAIASEGVSAPAPVATSAPAPTSDPAPTFMPPPAAVVEAPAQAEPQQVDPAPVIPAPVMPEPEPEVDIEATVREAPEVPEEPEVSSIPAMPGAPAAPEEPAGYDYLFGDTMYRSVSDAAVHEPDPEAEAEAVDAPPAGPVDDVLHDGETVLTSDIAKIRGKRRPKKSESEAGPPPAPANLVLAITPTGAKEPLSQPVLVGRSPSVSKVSGGQIPRLVTIGTIDQDISRNHAQFSLEGGTVVVTDLHSRNGTMIALPGKSPQKLRAGEPTSVIVGTVVDFGGGVTITVEEE